MTETVTAYSNKFDGTPAAEYVPDLPTITVDNGVETFNNRINTTKNALINYVLTMLGYPLITVELTPEQFDCAISNACHAFTKFATFPERYMCIDFSEYDHNTGLNLKKHNISQIKDINFVSPMQLGMTTSELCFGISGFISQQSTWRNFSFISLQLLHEYKELAERMLFPKPDWTYNNVTGQLTLYPAPNTYIHNNPHMYMVGGRWCTNIPAVITCEIEPPLEELYSDEAVKTLTLGYCKMMLGTIRSKFSNITLPGGGTVNGDDLRREGQAEIDKSLEFIRNNYSYGNMFVIA